MVTGLQFDSMLGGVAWIVGFAVVASAAVAGISIQRGVKRDSVVNRVLTIWLLAALAGVAALTLQSGPHGIGSARPPIFNPISRLDTGDALANALLFLPVGLFAALLWRSKPRIVARATGFAFAVSLMIEVAQWVLPIDRAATTHDVIFNTLGGFVGAAIGALIARLAHGRRWSARSEERDVRTL